MRVNYAHFACFQAVRSLFAKLQRGLQVLGGEAVDPVAVEDTMGWAHGSLR